MSHFVVLTLVRPEDAETPETLGNKVADLLAPYDENMEVEHYRSEEDDDGDDYTTAKRVERMIEFYNSREEREKMYPTTYEALQEKGGEGLFSGEDYLRSRLKGNIKQMDEIDRLLEKYGPPKADDRESLRRWYAGDWSGEDLYFDLQDGTPFIMTTYNPRSKWDYYLIGGHWTGMLTGYDPAEDPENWETCWVCEGTGRRDDELGLRHRERNPEYACNGCDGKGWHVKCPSRFRDHEGDVQPVANLLKQIEESVPGELTEEQKKNEKLPPFPRMAPPTVSPVIPYAVLTLDGEWHQRGNMGRFSISHDEREYDDWAKTATGILTEHADCYAVVVDCHI